MDVLNTMALAAHYGPYADGGSEWWWVGRLIFFLFWVTVIFLAFRWFARNRRGEISPMERARGILAERYARGEIDADEYRQRLDGLGS